MHAASANPAASDAQHCPWLIKSLDLHDLSLLLHRDTRLRGACIERARKRLAEAVALADGAEPSLKRKRTESYDSLSSLQTHVDRVDALEGLMQMSR